MIDLFIFEVSIKLIYNFFTGLLDILDIFVKNIYALGLASTKSASMPSKPSKTKTLVKKNMFERRFMWKLKVYQAMIVMLLTGKAI